MSRSAEAAAAGSWWPASATSSSATTASASRWPGGWPARPCPAASRSADFGIRGVHLAYELLDGYDAAILVDASPRGEAPGTVYVIEPDLDGEPDPAVEDGTGALVDAHGMEPDAVFALLRALGGDDRPKLLRRRLRAGRGGGADGAQPAGGGRGRPGRRPSSAS